MKQFDFSCVQAFRPHLRSARSIRDVLSTKQPPTGSRREISAFVGFRGHCSVELVVEGLYTRSESPVRLINEPHIRSEDFNSRFPRKNSAKQSTEKTSAWLKRKPQQLPMRIDELSAAQLVNCSYRSPAADFLFTLHLISSKWSQHS